jgi:HPt (histidine-containing phosphotransfer) domain-containing protein
LIRGIERETRREVIGDTVDKEASIAKIRLHLAEQFNLPKERIGSMLPSFIATLESHMGNLEKSLLEDDHVLIGKAGHTIKGAFLNLGLHDCAELALAIEEKGRVGATYQEFKKSIEELRALLQPILE